MISATSPNRKRSSRFGDGACRSSHPESRATSPPALLPESPGASVLVVDPIGVIVALVNALLGRSEAATARKSAAELADRSNLFEPRWRAYPRARAALVHLQEVFTQSERHVLDGYGGEPGDYWETFVDRDAVEAERRAVINELALVGPGAARAAFEESHALFLRAADGLKWAADLHVAMAKEAREHREKTATWQLYKEEQGRIELRSYDEWVKASALLEEFETVCRTALGGAV